MEFQTLSEFLSWEPPKLEDIMSEGLLVPTSKMVIYGPFVIGKSVLANQIAFHIASGSKLFNMFQCYPNFVWRVQLELPKAQDHKRVLKYARANHGKKPPTNIAFTTTHYLKLDTDAGVNTLHEVLVKHPEIRVVILDPLYKLLTGSITDARDIGSFCDRMDLFINKFNIAIIIVTHTRKRIISGRGDLIDLGAEEILGSNILPGWADTILGLRPMGPDQCQLNFNKVRYGEQLIAPMNVILDRERLRFRLV